MLGEISALTPLHSMDDTIDSAETSTVAMNVTWLIHEMATVQCLLYFCVQLASYCLSFLFLLFPPFFTGPVNIFVENNCCD